MPAPLATKPAEAEPRAANDTVIRSILVVDDSRAQLKIISSILRRWGYDVAEANSGAAALEIAQERSVDLVISDWMMPGMTGLELQDRLAQVFGDHFVYFILLTSRSEKADIAAALEAGADDFLSKPLNIDELHARISSADRLTRMQRELAKKNALISQTLEELKGVYAALDRDVEEAQAFQQSLVRDRLQRFEGADVSLILKPSGQVGGDLVGCFEVSAGRIGIYAIDVAGHGITSALMAARLASYLSGNTPASNIALKAEADGAYSMRPLDEISRQLNDLVMDEMGNEKYFTMALTDIDLSTGAGLLVQAGHPHPLLLRADGSADRLGSGGLPVGMVRDARFKVVAFSMAPGDRLLLSSDGVSAGGDHTDIEATAAWLLTAAQRHSGASGTALLDALFADACAATGGGELDDDFSAALLELKRP